jgi:retron-type reverse transcriptase
MHSINGSYVTLIPKHSSPASVGDYMPISLLNTSVKVLTKLLANRLQFVITMLVHQNQYGFLKARTIQDCLAWVFEYISLYHKSGKEMVILKLDFKKAFDKLEHATIIAVLRHKGFGDKWIYWISSILGSGTSEVLLNGVLGRRFHCKRGVRQGGPLSPLLFVLAADLLQSIVNKARDCGILRLPLPNACGTDFPVIQYADDTILILEACLKQLSSLRRCLTHLQNLQGSM